MSLLKNFQIYFNSLALSLSLTHTHTHTHKQTNKKKSKSTVPSPPTNPAPNKTGYQPPPKKTFILLTILTYEHVQQSLTTRKRVRFCLYFENWNDTTLNDYNKSVTSILHTYIYIYIYIYIYTHTHTHTHTHTTIYTLYCQKYWHPLLMNRFDYFSNFYEYKS